MILVDSNLLLYARVSTFPQHDAARRWLEPLLIGNAPVGLPWASLLSFLRIVTNPRLFDDADSPASAWTEVERWLDCPAVWIPSPGEQHRTILGKLLLRHGTHANLVPDVHLAALAIEHGLVLCSADGDFARFEDLKWENPLAS